jgi:hypothetical protein
MHVSFVAPPHHTHTYTERMGCVRSGQRERDREKKMSRNILPTVCLGISLQKEGAGRRGFKREVVRMCTAFAK